MTIHECLTDDDLLPLAVGELPNETQVEHLATCSQCRQRVESLQAEVAHLRTLPDRHPAQTDRPAMIGKYLVIGELPGGSQGRIFRALHPTLEQEVLIKLARQPASGRSDFHHLIVAEGKHLARLEHPNLVRVYDLDFHEGAPFMALEYVRGQSLEQYVAGRRLPPREAAALLARVLHALEAVHKAGLVHQDLKPQNILLDADRQPRLIDFGLARFRHAWDPGADQVSGGTPAFMAPEQASKNLEAVGPRTDLFAVGAVLYWLLTGKVPYPGPGVDRALEQARRCEFDRAALEAAEAPAALRALCLRALAQRPEDRPSSAADMARELERIAAGPAPLRRRLLIAAGVAAGIAVIGLGAWMLFGTPGPAPVKPRSDVSLEVVVKRNGKYLPLSRELTPLEGKRDSLQITARVPPGYFAALYHLDADGLGHLLPTGHSEADTFARLDYPASGLGTLDPDRRGSEVFLVCAAAGEARLKGIEKLLTDVGALPDLGAGVLLTLDRDEPRFEGQGVSQMGPVRADPGARARKLLDQLREELRKKGVLFRGVAFGRR
jgi:hypothetical protein